MKSKDVVIISLLAVVLFVQEQLLMVIPNVSLTIILMILYSKKLGLKKTLLIIFVYCMLDNLYMSSFNIVFTPVMLIGWFIIPITLNTVFKKVNNIFHLSLIAFLLSLTYSWAFVIPSCLMFDMNVITYMIADIPYELILGISSFATTLILYKPLSRVFDKYLAN